MTRAQAARRVAPLQALLGARPPAAALRRVANLGRVEAPRQVARLRPTAALIRANRVQAARPVEPRRTTRSPREARPTLAVAVDSLSRATAATTRFCSSRPRS